ncbi:flagellar biosynthesis repressor FlbT [Lutibaculum baratangense]|uniref:Putative flagellar protein FlbT n=1 Tax=Lutibaculum baratangense AMV1 TaxID=631454 RepID=V4RUL4_9HYPH|nr:flagellar biosynthesis repressor FlbT [Lutibaculum baratangense]ESR26765.1 putative flagellar protein FlbT [Lutibaculum baratangense AMV1]
MALKVELKPGERFILGTSVITNDNQRTRLYIQGDAPVLREKDILTAETADTPAKRIYLAVQLLYLGLEGEETRELYFKLVNELVAAVPSTLPYVDRINNLILTNALYKALREAKVLIQYETELLEHAQRSAGLRPGDTTDG